MQPAEQKSFGMMRVKYWICPQIWKEKKLKMDDTTHVLHLEAVIKSYNHCTRLGDWTDELTFFGLINDFEASSPNSVLCSILTAWKTKQKRPLPLLFCCH